MSSLSKEAVLVHEALVARGLETPMRAPVQEIDNETRKRLITGHMTEIMQLAWLRSLIKGSANFNNYRYGYWILCATSRTMNTNFAPRKSKERHTCRRNINVITE